MGRIAQGTKVLAEGGYDRVFRQTFETVPEEQLLNAFACYLSTSAGPVMGVLYVSTAKLAYCSDNPLSYKIGSQTEWNYYQVVIPLRQLKAINPSASKVNPAEKYIQIISVDGHEFWFMGFLNYKVATTSSIIAPLHRHKIDQEFQGTKTPRMAFEARKQSLRIKSEKARERKREEDGGGENERQ
ncbi:hypothetical protein V6N13_024262 [Hibiscus sabdariffa]